MDDSTNAKQLASIITGIWSFQEVCQLAPRPLPGSHFSPLSDAVVHRLFIQNHLGRDVKDPAMTRIPVRRHATAFYIHFRFSNFSLSQPSPHPQARFFYDFRPDGALFEILAAAFQAKDEAGM